MNEDCLSIPLPVDRLGENYFAVLNAEVARKTTSGVDVIRMDVGSPDLPPAPHIVEALIQSATRVDSHGYQPHRGISALREALVAMYRRDFGVMLEDAMVLPLIGSKEGVFHLSLAWLNPDDLVLIPDPGYQTYAQAARFAGAEVISIPLLPQNNFLPELGAIPEEIACKARMFWLNYPNNPTGAMAHFEFFQEAVEFCRQYGILLCHDAAYSQVTFNNSRAPSVLQVPGAARVALEFGSLSKVYNMAGWRLGYAAGRMEAVSALLKLKTHADSGHSQPVMEAAVVALQGDQSWVKARNTRYQARRDMLLAGLHELGFAPHQPKGAIYVWCPVPEGWGSEPFAITLLEKAGVSLAPGTIFGTCGEGFVRISLTQPEARIQEALGRMRLVNW